MVQIQATFKSAGEAYQQAVQAAETNRQTAYSEAIEQTGINRNEYFEGEPDLGLMHHHGTAAFEPETFRGFGSFADKIEEARAQAEDEPARVPILFLNYGRLDFDSIDNSRQGRSTSLALVEAGPLVVSSAVKVIENVVVDSEGGTATVTERIAGLRADTATIGADITKPRQDEDPVIVTARPFLPLYLSRTAAIDYNEYSLAKDEPHLTFKSVSDRHLGEKGSHPSIDIGWSVIIEKFRWLASVYRHGDNDPMTGSSTMPRSTAPPLQQLIDMKVLSDALPLTDGETEEVHAIQKLLSEAGDQIASEESIS